MLLYSDLLHHTTSFAVLFCLFRLLKPNFTVHLSINFVLLTFWTRSLRFFCSSTPPTDYWSVCNDVWRWKCGLNDQHVHLSSDTNSLNRPTSLNSLHCLCACDFSKLYHQISLWYYSLFFSPVLSLLSLYLSFPLPNCVLNAFIDFSFCFTK